MAKTIMSSIYFTTLLIVVLFISSEIPKSEATCHRVLGLAVNVTVPCRERACEAACVAQFPLTCRGECEDLLRSVRVMNDIDDVCRCYGRRL
ncbi:unnamed protein product [Cochlearia groenlandica]